MVTRCLSLYIIYKDAESIEQAPQDSDQIALFFGGQPIQALRWFGQAFEQEGAEAGAFRSEFKNFDAAVVGRRTAANQTTGFEPVHESGDIGSIARQGFRQPAHRERLSRLHQAQNVTLSRRQLKFRSQRPQVGALGKEEFQQ